MNKFQLVFGSLCSNFSNISGSSSARTSVGMESHSSGLTVYFALVGTWLCVGVLVNICIVVVVAKDRAGKKIINLFVGSIALSDMLLAGFVLPEQLHDVSHAGDYFERKCTRQRG